MPLGFRGEMGRTASLFSLGAYYCLCCYLKNLKKKAGSNGISVCYKQHTLQEHTQRLSLLTLIS